MSEKNRQFPSEVEFIDILKEVPLGLRLRISSSSSLRSDTDLDISKKRSERTTFNLSSEALETLEYLTKSFNVKFKDIFDQMIERFIKTLSWNLIENNKEYKKLLYQNLTDLNQKEVRKTFVISLNALKELNWISKYLNFPRDTIINFIITEYYLHLEEMHKAKAKKLAKSIEKLWIVHRNLMDIIKEIEKYISFEEPMLYSLYELEGIFQDKIQALTKELTKYEFLKKE